MATGYPRLKLRVCVVVDYADTRIKYLCVRKYISVYEYIWLVHVGPIHITYEESLEQKIETTNLVTCPFTVIVIVGHNGS